jgi:maltose O-acetyltransferase
VDIVLSAYRKLKRKVKKRLLDVHRWELLRDIKGGEALYLEDKIKLIFPENLTLGRNVYIGADAYINCKGGVTIGDHTILSRHVVIYSYDHNFNECRRLPFDEHSVERPVHIGRYVWVGMNAIIAPGTRIGDGAVIGMGTVISGDIPENAIVVSAKTRIVGYRDKEHTNELAQEGRFYDSYWSREQ